VDELHAAVAQASGKQRGVAVNAQRNGSQPLRPVVDGVHAGHDREQDLRRADVAGGLLAPDVLLAGLECQSVRRPAIGVDRYANEPSRQAALQPRPYGDESGVWPAEAQRHAESL
jgi:hypothetical protein